MQTARSSWYSNLVQSFTSTIFPIPTLHYLQGLLCMSTPPEDSVSQESIWDFDVNTVLGILNTPDLSPIQSIEELLVVVAAQVRVL